MNKMKNFKPLIANNVGIITRYNFHFKNNYTVYFCLSLYAIYIDIKMVYILLDSHSLSSLREKELKVILTPYTLNSLSHTIRS